MRSERFEFPNAKGEKLAAVLDLPLGEPTAYALFAHCFTCGKDNLAAKRIARRSRQSRAAGRDPQALGRRPQAVRT